MALALSSAYRADLQTLTGLAQRDLLRLWTDLDSATAARESLYEILPRLTTIYGEAAATVAADYYDEARAQAEVKGRFRAIPQPPVEGEALDILARVAVGSLFGDDPDEDAARTLAAGGLQRHIVNAARGTVTFSSVQDRGARGWQRVGFGSCDFCSMLLSRGAVYSEASADFQAHDHCHCVAEPAFR